MMLRTWIANKLVALARKIDPPNKAATAFLMDTVMEAMITGQAAYKVTRVGDMRSDGKTPGDA